MFFLFPWGMGGGGGGGGGRAVLPVDLVWLRIVLSVSTTWTF